MYTSIESSAVRPIPKTTIFGVRQILFCAAAGKVPSTYHQWNKACHKAERILDPSGGGCGTSIGGDCVTPVGYEQFFL